MINENFNLNTFHHDKWRLSFSNIPGIESADMRLYDNFVKSLTIPDYNMGEIKSKFRDFVIRHQIAPNVNNDFTQLQVDFKLTEDMANYLNLFNWMMNVKYGQVDTSEEAFRKYMVKRINLEILDNQKRTIAILYFTNANLVNLSSLSLVMGSSDEVIFTTNWTYEELEFEVKSINS